MSGEEFMAFTSTNFPAVATGVEALPQIVPTFDGLIDTLDSQRDLFDSADQIPTKDMPATTVPWGLFFGGLAFIAAGVFLYKPGWLGPALTGGLGVLIVVAVLIMTLIPKAADADELNDNLSVFYTAETVAQAKGALATVGAMGSQMQSEMLPALAEQLGLSDAELGGFLGENFPATAQALGALPEALPRFEGLVTTFENNLDNYDTIKPVAFSPIVWTMLIGGIVAILAFGLVWWTGRKEGSFEMADRLSHTRATEKAGV